MKAVARSASENPPAREREASTGRKRCRCARPEAARSPRVVEDFNSAKGARRRPRAKLIMGTAIAARSLTSRLRSTER